MIELLRNQLDCLEDIKFEFDPVAHRYTYEGEPFNSVTRFIIESMK